MAKFKNGDKFIIEIDKVYGGYGDDVRYKIAGFNTLMFDDNGLDRLEMYEDKAKEPKVTNDDKFKEVFGESIEDWVKRTESFTAWADSEYKNKNTTQEMDMEYPIRGRIIP